MVYFQFNGKYQPERMFPLPRRIFNPNGAYEVEAMNSLSILLGANHYAKSNDAMMVSRSLPSTGFSKMSVNPYERALPIKSL